MPAFQVSYYVQAAHGGHLQVQKDEIRLKIQDLTERLLAVLSFPDDHNVFNLREFVSQDVAGYRFVVSDHCPHATSLEITPIRRKYKNKLRTARVTP